MDENNSFENKKADARFKSLSSIEVTLLIMQSLLLFVRQIVFTFAEETLYSRSIVTMIFMAVLTAVIILYCRCKKCSMSVFPAAFSFPYIVFTVIAIIFYAVTLFFVNMLSLQNILMLFYGSIVTPVFEELLFRGVIWNKLSKFFSKEWKTYLIVTFLFALWHIGYAVGLYMWRGGSLINCIIMKTAAGAVFGLITGALRLKTKNCYLGILIHGILNSL